MHRLLFSSLLKKEQWSLSHGYHSRRPRRGGLLARPWLWVTGAMLGAGGVAWYTTLSDATHPSWKTFFLPQLMHRLDAETAHRVAVLLASWHLLPTVPVAFMQSQDQKDLLRTTTLNGCVFSHPIGLAAGFDKNAEAIRGLARLGFTSIEVGTVVPQPQPGQPRPRVFRLTKDQAIINRYGFNSEGVERVAQRLESLTEHPCIVGINIGKNKETDMEHAADDYEACISKLAMHSDYLVINVSSPNTPNLRVLQSKKELEKILRQVHTALDQFTWAKEDKAPSTVGTLRRRPPVLVKVAPGLSTADKKVISEMALQNTIQGIVISNTTTERPTTLRSDSALTSETGGLSGRPLLDVSTRDLAEFHRLTRKRVPLIGVGGVATGHDAYVKIRNGASLVQIYTALTYQGPGVVVDIVNELSELLKRDGFKNVQEAVGVDVK